MINLLDSNNLTDNLPEFTVSDLSVMIKKKIEGEFSYIRVRGEVGRISRPASGHTYMDFRENKSVHEDCAKKTRNWYAMSNSCS